MGHGVYLESSVVDLRPALLDCLSVIVEKVKEVKDNVIALKRKDLAEQLGKDVRTTSRYLKELSDHDILEVSGRKGRSGGTVIRLNAEKFRFDTSEKALINQETPIDEIAEMKFPKKQYEPEKEDKNKRNRRTKREMIEARILQNKRQKELDRLHNKLEKLGGVPDWNWFLETDDPVGNYKTYLLTRLYNRYAVLYVDYYNESAGAEILPKVSKNYDVLPRNFFGSSRWNHFEKLRNYCEENNIDPFVYLTAAFNRSIFISAKKAHDRLDSGITGSKKINALPYPNTLLTEYYFEAYLDFCNVEVKRNQAYVELYKELPIGYAHDLVVRTLREAYDNAHKQTGFFQYKYALKDFLYGEGASDKDIDLANYYDIVSEDLRKQGISADKRNVIKKFLLIQLISLSDGGYGFPTHVIAGSEPTRLIMASIDNIGLSKDKRLEYKALALSNMVYRYEDEMKNLKKGYDLLWELTRQKETPLLFRLIMQRKGLYIDLLELQKAIKEYGKEKIPLDDISMLDVKQIQEFMNAVEEKEKIEEDIDLAEIARNNSVEYVLEGAVSEDEAIDIDRELESFLQGAV